MLAEVFENIPNKCIEVYEFDPAQVFTVPGLTGQAVLKETYVKLDQLTDNNMLLMIEKGIGGGVCLLLSINMRKLISNT